MIRRSLLAVALTLAACDVRGGAAASIVISASARGLPLELEVAVDPETRERGLMFRRDIPENGGMLFVYPSADLRGFWMRNTYVPLSIAFLDDSGRIASIDDMEPFDETPHMSAEPTRYAVEVPYGWFTSHGVGPGDVVSFALPAGLVAR
jgi:uncharacterized membrane protein (UPF0127 family)